MEEIFATFEDDYEFEWQPEFGLDFEKCLVDNKDLTVKGEAGEETPSTSETGAVLNDAEFIEENININPNLT